MQNTIIFKLKSSTQSKSAPIPGQSIKGREARELIAASLTLPEMETVLMFNGVEVENEQSIDAFSELEVERRLGRTQGKPQSAYLDAARAKEKLVQVYVGQEKSSLMDPMMMASGGSAATTPLLPGGAVSSSVPGGTPKTEEEMIAAMNNAVAQENGGALTMMGRNNRRGQTQAAGDRKPPSPFYVCHNCMQKGHYIEDCPQPRNFKGKMLAAPLGIAESKLERVDPSELENGEVKGTHFITKNGVLVRRKVETGVFAGVDDLHQHQQGEPILEEGEVLPLSVVCGICNKVAEDAMTTECCKAKKDDAPISSSVQFCSKCIDKLFEEPEEEDDENEEDDDDFQGPQCPACKEPLDFEDVLPAVAARKEIKEYLVISRRKRPRGDE